MWSLGDYIAAQERKRGVVWSERRRRLRHGVAGVAS